MYTKWFLWFGIFLHSVTFACEPPGLDQEVAQLIQAVAESGAKFERNGSVHNAEKAAEHLKLKFSRGKKYVSSSEDFINKLASKSSLSGKSYWMIIGAEERVKSRDWLLEKLQEIRLQACSNGH